MDEVWVERRIDGDGMQRNSQPKSPQALVRLCAAVFERQVTRLRLARLCR